MLATEFQYIEPYVLCWAFVEHMLRVCWALVGSTLGHVGHIDGRIDWAMLGLCWAYVEACFGPVLPRLRHAGPMLGLCWPMLGLCWAMLSPSLAT